jgi:hypothetical protein
MVIKKLLCALPCGTAREVCLLLILLNAVNSTLLSHSHRSFSAWVSNSDRVGRVIVTQLLLLPSGRSWHGFTRPSSPVASMRLARSGIKRLEISLMSNAGEEQTRQIYFGFGSGTTITQWQ